ncbi:extracellular solute-binding protein [Amphibacillus sediminis]|uniref:extracellular solute-binding protein n=1 Tax=Amphibacillus sediminis TaxID=360185 RepID=UPI000836C72D|nr:extracellular solute-binding protein [Amphibacillus sediminis]
MKKLLSLVIGLVSLLLISACGDNEQSWSDDYGLEDITFPVEEDVSLKIMTNSAAIAPDDPNDKLIFQRLEEETGVHIEWLNFVGETFDERRNLAMATGEMPDAIMNANFSDYELLNYAEDGAIIPLNDLIKNYMPNLRRVLEEAPQYEAMMTAPDGNIYAFPWIEELGEGKERIQAVENFPWINVEWLDELGLDMPSTTDELKEVLIAFRDHDMAGNGETIPMSFIINHGGEDPGFLFSSFGLGDNFDRMIVNGDHQVVSTVTDKGYKDAINFMYELYSEGLIDVEAFEHDWPTYVAKGQQGRYGLYFTWDKGNITGMGDDYDLMGPLAGPDGRVHVTQTNAIGFHRQRMVITSVNENLELTAKWIDQLYDPHQSVQNNWGTYGDDEKQNIFEFDEQANMLRHLPLEGTAPVELREETSVGGPLAILDSYYGAVTTMPDDAAWRLELMKDVMSPHMSDQHVYPNILFSKDELDRLSVIEADLFPYINRKRAEWMTNGQADAEWEDYLLELERLGLNEWLDIKQEAYDRYLDMN